MDFRSLLVSITIYYRIIIKILEFEKNKILNKNEILNLELSQLACKITLIILK